MASRVTGKVSGTMVRRSSRALKLLLIAALALSASACSGIQEMPEEQAQGESELEIEISHAETAENRAVFDRIDSYRVLGSGPDGAEFTTAGKSSIFNVDNPAAGSWTIRVLGLDETGKTVAEGAENVEVEADRENKVDVGLVAVAGSDGEDEGSNGEDDGSGDSGTDEGTLEFDKPNASNTGPVGLLTPYSGPNHITVAGTVVENVSITGTIYIEADNVVFRNFSLDASGSPYGFSIDSACSGILIESGLIVNMKSAAILGTGFTARKLHIYDSGGDAIKPQGLNGYPVLVEACYIYQLGMLDGAHADGCQINTLSGGGKNVTFRYNTIDMPAIGSANYPGDPYKSNAAFELQSSISNFVIEHNWLNGGGYTVRRDKYDGLPSGVYVRNNKFGRDFTFAVSSGTYEEWKGNTWEDTGAEVTVDD